MKLIAIPGTDKVPQTIEIYSHSGNKYAAINRHGSLVIFGENEPLYKDELKKVNVISENFDLFYTQLIRLQNEVQDLLTPTLRQ